MQAKVETCESEMTDKDNQFADKLRSMEEEHLQKNAALTEKLEQLKSTFEAEKQRVEQDARDQMTRLKADLDAS